MDVNQNDIDNLAKRVYDMIRYTSEKEDAKDIPEFLALEIIDLAEIMSPEPDVAKLVADKVIGNYDLPYGTNSIVKRYFDLPY